VYSARHLLFKSIRRISFAALVTLVSSQSGSTMHAAERVADPLAVAAEPASNSNACTATPQGSIRRLTGTVSDQTGASITHASLTLQCGEFRQTVTTNSVGVYSFSAPSGRYQLTVEAPHFATLHENVMIQDSATGSEINPVLHPEQLHSSVTVTADNAYQTSVASGGLKTSLPLSETPQAISIINRDLMNSQNVTKLDDALKNASGVIAGGYYDGWDYYRIRGFDASFNTYIDGLRGGNGVAEETWGLESVEILKGPSSALYGQSVLGGLVNIVTRKPVPANFAHLQVTTGSYNYVDPALDAGHVLNSSHSLYGRIEALYHSADTFVDYTHRNRYYFAPTLTWRPSSATSLTLIGRAERDNGRQAMPLPALGTVLTNPHGVIPVSRYIGELKNNANKMQQATQQAGYQFYHKWNDHLSMHQNLRMAWYQQEWNRIYYPSYLATDERTLYRYPLSWHGPWQAHEVDTNLEGHATFLGMEHSALAGVDFYRSPSHGVGYIGGNEALDLFKPVYGANSVQALSKYTDSLTTTQYMGFYLQDHIRLRHNITVTGGGRLDLAKNESKGSANQNGNGLTPRIGVTWQAIPTTTFYGSYSKSFLPQSGSAWNGTSSGSYLPPERGQQWEGGAKSSFLNGHLTTTVAAFQLNRKNVATTDPGHANYSVVTGEQRSRGVELEAAMHPLAGWNLTTAYSYINAEVLHDNSIAAGTPTLNSPKNLFNIWTNYEVPRGAVRGLSVGIGGRHYTDQAGDTSNSFQLPGYGIVDASMGYRRGHAQWQLNANNIGDKRYASGSYNDVYVKPGEPRTIRTVLSWNF